MTDQLAAGLTGLLLFAIKTLAPLVGAVVAALAIRRRGRNARLAFAGCLVMLPEPILSTFGPALWSGSLIRGLGPLMVSNVLTVIVLPFQLVGFGLLLAGALSAPRPPQPAGQPAAGQPFAHTAPKV
ncbi:hypothetical protein [Kitasatospora sp. GAS204B]|uniref:hypothetical protein n=1 Tax=unclassified Kitasatospora TaxID=2633591 RepID=UPI002475E6F3|nr:hypothetical protein [Kitasatospora sp. GAS204B]MDH6122485.1 hypothetical protein [Kitasatospora sp. GAS204B]